MMDVRRNRSGHETELTADELAECDRKRGVGEPEDLSDLARDCVRALKLANGMTELVGLDATGTACVTLTLPSASITGTDEMWLLDRVRQIHPPLRLVG